MTCCDHGVLVIPGLVLLFSRIHRNYARIGALLQLGQMPKPPAKAESLVVVPRGAVPPSLPAGAVRAARDRSRPGREPARRGSAGDRSTARVNETPGPEAKMPGPEAKMPDDLDCLGILNSPERTRIRAATSGRCICPLDYCG